LKKVDFGKPEFAIVQRRFVEGVATGGVKG
jgi:hypothetical protein